MQTVTANLLFTLTFFTDASGKFGSLMLPQHSTHKATHIQKHAAFLFIFLSQKSNTWDIKSSHANYSPSETCNSILKKEFTNPFSRKLKPAEQQFRIQKQNTHTHTSKASKAANTAQDSQQYSEPPPWSWVFLLDKVINYIWINKDQAKH